MIVPRKRSNLICGCGGIGRRARLRILCSQDMQVRVLSTAPVKPCDYYNHRVFSYHFAGIKTEWEIRKHRKQSKNLKKTLLHFAIFSVFIYRRGKGGLKNRHPDDIRSPKKPTFGVPKNRHSESRKTDIRSPEKPTFGVPKNRHPESQKTDIWSPGKPTQIDI